MGVALGDVAEHLPRSRLSGLEGEASDPSDGGSSEDGDLCREKGRSKVGVSSKNEIL